MRNKLTYSCKCSDALTYLPGLNIIEPNEGRSLSCTTSVPRRPVSLLCITTRARILTLKNTPPLPVREEVGS